MARGVRYDDDVRRRAAELFEAGAGHRLVAAALEIPDATARQWSRAFSAGGADAVLGGGSRRMTYDLETKLDAVRDHLDRGKSIREVMVKYHIASESSIKLWCRAYRREGAEGLEPKRRGRPPKGEAGPRA